MTISVYEASVPVFNQYLEALSATIGKAAAYATAKKIEPGVVCQLRLFPDMLPLMKQGQVAADFAKNACSRLAGQEPPRFSDTETNLAELQGRIARTLAHIRGLPRTAIEEGGDRKLTIPAGGEQTLDFIGRTYLLHYALPNFFFHVTAVYAILRANGVELVKRDFMGPGNP